MERQFPYTLIEVCQMCLRCNRCFFFLSLSLSFYLKRPRSFGLQQHYCDFDFGSKVTFSEFIGDPKNIVNIMPRNVIGSLEFYNERLFNLNRGLTSFPFLQG